MKIPLNHGSATKILRENSFKSQKRLEMIEQILRNFFGDSTRSSSAKFQSLSNISGQIRFVSTILFPPEMKIFFDKIQSNPINRFFHSFFHGSRDFHSKMSFSKRSFVEDSLKISSKPRRDELIFLPPRGFFELWFSIPGSVRLRHEVY